MKRIFQIHNIRNKIFYNFLFLFLITSGGLLTLYTMTLRILSDMAQESVEVMLDQINAETYKVMSHVLQTGYMIAGDASIQFPLRNPFPTSPTEVYEQRLEYNNKLFYTNQYQESISGIYVIGRNGAVFRSTMMSLAKEDYRDEAWFLNTLEEGTPLWLSNQNGSILAKSLIEPYISLTIPINDRSSTRLLGVIVVEVKGETFHNIFKTGFLLEGDILLLDSTNNMFLYSEETSLTQNHRNDIEVAIGQILSESDQSTKISIIDGEQYLLSVMNIPVNNWKIVGLIPYQEILSRTNIIEKSIGIVLVVFVVIMFLFMLRISYLINNPIKKLSKTMKIVESGNFDIQVDVGTNDEFGNLASSFNHMLQRINLLTAKEIDNQKKVRIAELKAWQAQINPHFLYNTLESISWMARLNKIDKVEEMINSLSTYFRISISRGSDLITLRDELTHVEKYLSIQKIRYDKKLNYSIEVPDEILEYKTIKMLLQPLVENSIYHGIKEKEGPGEIKITAAIADHIVLCVEDTGIGMTAEKLRELREMIASGRDYDQNAYGVINVHKRIQVYFGEEYGLHFESEFNIGTRVYATIRKITDS